MNVVRCDYEGCDDTRPADVDLHGWLAVEETETFCQGAVTYDFCCHAHLASWATWRHELKQKKVKQ